MHFPIHLDLGSKKQQKNVGTQERIRGKIDYFIFRVVYSICKNSIATSSEPHTTASMALTASMASTASTASHWSPYLPMSGNKRTNHVREKDTFLCHCIILPLGQL